MAKQPVVCVYTGAHSSIMGKDCKWEMRYNPGHEECCHPYPTSITHTEKCKEQNKAYRELNYLLEMAHDRIDRDQDRLRYAEEQLVEITNELEFLRSGNMK